jgi:Icc-related predicted phosphoesterase
MRETTRTMLVAAAPKGELDMVEHMVKLAPEVGADAIGLVGDLSGEEHKRETFRRIFEILGQGKLPAYFVPGPHDAPSGDYLREAYNLEIVFPFLHGVHGGFAFAPGYVVVAGMGGALVDDAEMRRTEDGHELRYPAWEAEYRLKALRELKDYQKVFLFTTVPTHKGLDIPGSDVVAELIKTYNPRLVVTHDPAMRGMHHLELGKSLVVFPGSLAEGEFAVIDLHSGKVETGNVR